ncbi:hypothetical protein EW145_g5059 [Phellinidium pouzarii]|uniref:RlpA-like protein double-psi beta-barrel domain-containing protein n=1 Tax=Phellinidium pouzarii TaxID=167371 RepID=A0A4S4L1H6_9AGAM|nr:hypothetical protein EW145_g5059 [Phellinidium pouzarii]
MRLRFTTSQLRLAVFFGLAFFFHTVSAVAVARNVSMSHTVSAHPKLLKQHWVPEARSQDHAPAYRPSSDLLDSSISKISKRSSSRLTYYEPGDGACGGKNGPNDMIVAINSAQYENGAHCWKMITIMSNGKQIKAQVVDECPGCPVGGLDLSPSLFQHFAPLDEGVISGHWSFIDASQDTAKEKPKVKVEPKHALPNIVVAVSKDRTTHTSHTVPSTTVHSDSAPAETTATATTTTATDRGLAVPTLDITLSAQTFSVGPLLGTEGPIKSLTTTHPASEMPSFQIIAVSLGAALDPAPAVTHIPSETTLQDLETAVLLLGSFFFSCSQMPEIP